MEKRRQERKEVAWRPQQQAQEQTRHAKKVREVERQKAIAHHWEERRRDKQKREKEQQQQELHQQEE